MPATSPCVPCCTTPQTTNIPGPEGDAGTDGADGVNAYTATTANFTVPAIDGNVTIAVADSSWMGVGQNIFVEGAGYFEVISKPSAASVTAQYLDYDINTHATELILAGAKVSPGGTQITATLTVARGGTGQTTTTAAFNALSPLTTKGDLLTNDGTNDVRQAVGTNGRGVFADSAQTNGIKYAGAEQTVNVNTTAAANVNVAETDLMSVSVTGGTLATDGDSLLAEGAIDFAANANNKTVRLKYGATTVLTVGPGAQSGGAMIFRMRIIRTAAATQRCYAEAIITTGGAFATVTTADTTAAETLSGAVTLKVTGQSDTASNDVTQRAMITSYRSV